MSLPGWNSLDAVRKIHNALEGGALLFFAGLVAFDTLAHFNKKYEKLFEEIALLLFAVAVFAEICAYPYSRRNDELSGQALTATEAEIARLRVIASTAEAKANSFALEIATANQRAAEANERTAKIQAAVADRDLSPEQQRNIRGQCARFSGMSVWIRSYPNDLEAARLIVVLKTSLTPYIHIEDRTGQLMATWESAEPILGIRVVPSDTDRPFAEALIKILRKDGGLSVADLSPFSSGLQTTEILVGMKPVVLLREAAAGRK